MTTPAKSLIPLIPIKDAEGKEQTSTNSVKYTGILDQEEQVSKEQLVNVKIKWIYYHHLSIDIILEQSHAAIFWTKGFDKGPASIECFVLQYLTPLFVFRMPMMIDKEEW